jgi:hypothetical protein
MTVRELCRRVGITPKTLYRRFKSPPWERGRGEWDEGHVFEKMARVLVHVRDRLLWLAGYNPFVASGLSPEALGDLYELNARVVASMKAGVFDGDLKGLVQSVGKRLSAKGGTDAA